MGQSMAVIQGEIVGRQRLKKGGLSLSLRGECGTFTVRVDKKLAQDYDLTIGQIMTVQGRLRSFVFKGCRSRHVYLEAQAIEVGQGSVDLEREVVRRLARLAGLGDQGEVIISPRSGR